MTKPIGVYIHVPFCANKCPYCDFYSVKSDDILKDAYTERLIYEIKNSKDKSNADSVYFGGGTPSLLGEQRLIRIFTAVSENFPLQKGYEATVEVNPADNLDKFLAEIKSAGINRLSVGMQSANDDELALLGRLHRHSDTVSCIKGAQRAGFDNYSLDIMLAIPGQSSPSLLNTADACSNLEATHASAYLLKIEEGTPYAKIQNLLSLPDDDTAAQLYLEACSLLEARGFMQYEISNFANPSKESIHNLKYWQCKEYLGFGPSAHSFISGKRFFYDRNIKEYIQSPKVFADGFGGDINEYALMALRLNKGINYNDICEKFKDEGKEKFFTMKNKAQKYVSAGFTNVSDLNISLTKNGFLVSNQLFCDIIE